MQIVWAHSSIVLNPAPCLAVTVDSACLPICRLRVTVLRCPTCSRLHAQVGEEERGYLLELLLTKLRFATSAAATANSALSSPGGGGGPNGMTEVEEPPFDWTTVGPAYQRDGLQVRGQAGADSCRQESVEMKYFLRDLVLCGQVGVCGTFS